MTRSRTLTITAVASALALTAAACGYTAPTGGAGGYSYAAAGPANSAPTESTVTVTSAALGPGTALVDGTGRALYLFANDTGSASTCSGACAGVWPPLPAPADLTAATGRDWIIRSVAHPAATAAPSSPITATRCTTTPATTNRVTPAVRDSTNSARTWYLVQPDGTALDND